MKEKGKHIGLWVDQETHYKFRYVAKSEGRSGNGEILYLIRREIENFEKEHGKIEIIEE